MSTDSAGCGMSIFWHMTFLLNSKEQCLIFQRNGSLFPCLPGWCMIKEQRMQKCSVFNTGILLHWWKWLLYSIFIHCKDWWNFSAWAVWDRKMTQVRNSHLWKPIADNSWQHWLFPPRDGTGVHNLHFAYITMLLLVFQTTAHAGQLKTEIHPLPWQGQCYL